MPDADGTLSVLAWNCNMAFRRKASAALALSPDLAIVAECESPARLNAAAGLSDCIWVGENPSKGVGVFSFSGLRLRLHAAYDRRFRYVAPVEVDGPERFTLIAIWAMPEPGNPSQTYLGQVWQALRAYEALLDGPVLIAGDFNSNVIWDRNREPARTMAGLVEFLRAKDIHSFYHRFFGEGFGQETQPTLYMYRKREKTYHIDYCFGSGQFAERLRAVEVGKYETWRGWSDHAPVLCSFDAPPRS